MFTEWNRQQSKEFLVEKERMGKVYIFFSHRGALAQCIIATKDTQRGYQATESCEMCCVNPAQSRMSSHSFGITWYEKNESGKPGGKQWCAYNVLNQCDLKARVARRTSQCFNQLLYLWAQRSIARIPARKTASLSAHGSTMTNGSIKRIYL